MIVLSKDLPGVNFPEYEQSTQMEDYLIGSLTPEGSIVLCFRYNNFGDLIVDTTNVMGSNKMNDSRRNDNGIMIQLYRLKSTYHMSVTIQVPYPSARMSFSNIFFCGENKLIKQIEERRITLLEKVMELCRHGEVVPRDDISGLLRSQKIEHNLSLLKIEQNRFASLLSIKNIESRNMSSVLVNENAIITLVKNSTIDDESIKEGIEKYIDISNEFGLQQKVKRRVHTLDSITGSKLLKEIEDIWYCNITYIVERDEINTLAEDVSMISDELAKREVVFYQHMSTSISQYLSFLPGNGKKGEEYSLLGGEYAKRLIGVYLGGNNA